MTEKEQEYEANPVCRQAGASVPAVPEPQAATVAPLPACTGEQMAQAFKDYQRLQAALDKAMPDAIMVIDGRPFRKKAYWRALRVAFGLTVQCLVERRIDSGEDWGYEVRYRATAPNGASADGDGACMASEKIVYDKATGEVDRKRTARNQTVHNVRGHAHTRAFNRAVSNLVGFGEVSAEEVLTSSLDEPVDAGSQVAPAGDGPPCPSCGSPMVDGRGKSGKGPRWVCPKRTRKQVRGRWVTAGCNGMMWDDPASPVSRQPAAPTNGQAASADTQEQEAQSAQESDGVKAFWVLARKCGWTEDQVRRLLEYGRVPARADGERHTADIPEVQMPAFLACLRLGPSCLEDERRMRELVEAGLPF